MEIRLEGPAKNALGTPLLTTIRDQLVSAGQEPILLTGAGDALSAGLDLKEIVQLQPDAMASFLELLQDVVSRLFHHPGPTVACVNGHAVAGGCVLARACDHAVATSEPRARIGLNEVALGLRFPPRVLQMLRHRIPRRHQPAVFLGAGLHPPDEALRLGLVDAVSDEPLATARAHLDALSRHPPGAYAAAKADLQGAVGHPDPAGERAFLETVVPVWTSPELRERIAAFLGRRKSTTGSAS